MIDEKMRIGGKKIYGENGTIDVFNPFNGEKVGSVPRASKGQVDQTMEIAKNFQPKLTRYERQQVLSKTAELLVSRRDEISDLITAESGLSKKDSLYEVGRAFDVLVLQDNFVSWTMVRFFPVTSLLMDRKERSSLKGNLCKE